MPSIIILASGNGSNFEAIVQAVKSKKIKVTIKYLLTDRDCYALTRAENNQIPALKITNNKFLKKYCLEADLIILSGFLQILPKSFVDFFKCKIINQHPSLLPKYGGAGMYGIKIHQKVIAAREKFSGCTVHYVTQEIDQGEIIAQKKVKLDKNETALSLQKKILKEEHKLIVDTIAYLLKN